jgi:hypothetical protein
MLRQFLIAKRGVLCHEEWELSDLTERNTERIPSEWVNELSVPEDED